MKDLSVIIVNYQTEDLIKDCVRSILSNNVSIQYEVIIVDNNSPGCSIDKLNHLCQNPNFTIIRLNENVGFGRANNEGLKKAVGRNVIFLNPDTIVCGNALEVMCNYIDTHDYVGACCANLYDEKMKPVHSYNMLIPSLFNEINHMLFGIPSRVLYGKNARFNYTNREYKVNSITGADLMTRKCILDKIGGFDPSFFMYYEDTELCHRIIKTGYELYSLPDAKIQHLEGKSFKNIERRAAMSFEGRENYYRLVYPWYYRICSKVLFGINCCAAYIISYIRNKPVANYWKVQFLMSLNLKNVRK